MCLPRPLPRCRASNRCAQLRDPMNQLADADTTRPAVSKPRRWRFGLRTLLVATLVFSLPLAGFVWRRERARQQADLVRRLEAAGAKVGYDYFYTLDAEGRRVENR